MFKVLLIIGLLFYLLYRFSGVIMRFLFWVAGRELEKKVRRQQQQDVVYQDEKFTVRKRPQHPPEGEYVDYEEV